MKSKMPFSLRHALRRSPHALTLILPLLSASLMPRCLPAQADDTRDAGQAVASPDQNATNGVPCRAGRSGCPLSSSLTISATSGSAVAGSSVTFIAAVSPTDATGSVSFFDGSSALGKADLVSGESTFSTTALAVGSHTIFAIYSGSGQYLSSVSSSATVVVTAAAPATLSLSASATTLSPGSPVTLTAMFSASSVNGVVSFNDGGAPLGRAFFSAGTAVLTPVLSTAGTHFITAIYDGSLLYPAATSNTVSVSISTPTPAPTPTPTPTPAPVAPVPTPTVPTPTVTTSPVALTPSIPTYGYQMLPGSSHTFYVQIAGGTSNLINWSISGTTGATLCTPSQCGVTSVGNALPEIQVNFGATTGTCSITGSSTYGVTSTLGIMLTAQSVDDNSAVANIPINLCARNPTPITFPDYQQAYQSQHVSIQSLVWFDTDETGTWNVINQPQGGDGTLSDTTFRDADFHATVSGRYTLNFTSHSDPTKTAQAIVYVSPNPMPQYSATPSLTVPRECYADPALNGSIFQVGQGKAYANLEALPTPDTWTPGTLIQLFNTDTSGASPSTYHEYMQILQGGTTGQPVRLCGVPDSAGNLPIIDGANATGQAGVSTQAAWGTGLVSAWAKGFNTGGCYGTWSAGADGFGSCGPSHISINGIHFRNANPNYSTYAPGGGALTAYANFASCIALVSGYQQDVSGNELENCGNGIFTNDNGNNGWASITQALSFVGNYAHRNGVSGDSTEHALYIQSWGALIEGNVVADYTAGAQGGAIKLRGPENIVRYNWLPASGVLRLIDLVEDQDSANYMTFEGYLGNNGYYQFGDGLGADRVAGFWENFQHGDLVYGNKMDGGSSFFNVHYYEDHDAAMAGRQGTLNFYNNTLQNASIVFDNGEGSPYVTTTQGTIDARNNILYAIGSQLSLNRTSNFVMSSATNLYKSGSVLIAAPILGGSLNAGTAFGWQSACDYTCPWPLTTPLDTHQFNLNLANFLFAAVQPFNSTTYAPAGSSAAIGAATTLTGIPAQNPVRWEYNTSTYSLTPRTSLTTIGAADPR